MKKDLRQIDFLTKWYKMFGIDYLFYKPDSTEPRIQKQEKQESYSFPNSLDFSNLDDLRNAVLKIDCPLKKMAKNTVFSDGSPDSDIMIIGEAPGQEEDEQGKPFVGQSGQLLNNMLLAVGLKRSEVYISNVLFWRPPGNRTPSTDELSLCLPYVERHIALINPKILLLLGGVAVKTILNTSDSISKIRGRKNAYRGIDTIATFHPAYLLRSPGQKAVAFRDFISLRRLLDSFN